LEPDWSLRIGRQWGNSRSPKGNKDRLESNFRWKTGADSGEADIDVGNALMGFESGRIASR
jgi:hypothetical protein